MLLIEKAIIDRKMTFLLLAPFSCGCSDKYYLIKDGGNVRYR
jgi:hypothetical protein